MTRRISPPGPVIDEHSRVLILGTSADLTSALKGEHYSGHGNIFWRVIGEVFNFSPEIPYDRRVAILLRREIALWNVSGLVGSGRDAATVVNDFASFFQLYPNIDSIFF